MRSIGWTIIVCSALVATAWLLNIPTARTGGHHISFAPIIALYLAITGILWLRRSIIGILCVSIPMEGLGIMFVVTGILTPWPWATINFAVGLLCCFGGFLPFKMLKSGADKQLRWI